MENNIININGLNQLSKVKGLWWVISFILLITATGVLMAFRGQSPEGPRNRNDVYGTWEVVSYYRNGKLSIADSKQNGLRFQINRDGTANWLQNGKKTTKWFEVNAEATKAITQSTDENGYETIYELSSTSMRFGKHQLRSHYEYVLKKVQP
jgi:hypothetical protein